MKTRLMLLASALAASLICLPTSAQTQPAPATSATAPSQPAASQGMGMGPGGGPRNGMRMRGPRDCSQAMDPAACNAHREFHNNAAAACRDVARAQRPACMQEQMQKVDCGKSPNPQQCEASKVAAQACQGQTGPAFRQCMQEKMPPVDCSKAANPARCEQHQKARAACQDKVGPEHKACLREHLKAAK